jgi:hypothetical protein
LRGCGGSVGGLVLEDDSAADDDDFEVDLAVDVVSLALPFTSMGFNELELESIPVATTLILCTLINLFGIYLFVQRF